MQHSASSPARPVPVWSSESTAGPLPRPRPWHRHLPWRTPRPTFLIIGAQKCGTSWLHRKLGEHPRVFVSRRKELHYFSNRANFARGLDHYLENFADAAARHIAIGESTPNYLWTAPEAEATLGGVNANDPEFRAGTPRRVADSLGTDLRLVVLLRDPVERAISAFYHHLRARGGGRIDVERSFPQNARRFGILTMGLYADHFERWLEAFDATRILVLINEEMQRAPASALAAVQRHLGLPIALPGGLEDRVHGGDKYQDADGRWYFDEDRRRLAIGPDEIAFLDEAYAPQHARLEALLGRSLHVWPSVRRSRGIDAAE